MKEKYREVSGILPFDKPPGLSSNQALQKVRRLFRAEKAGHTGSLDPLATGLLPICFGEATKIAGHLLGARKAYVAQCRLGSTTTTDDAEGDVVETRAVPSLDDSTIESALAGLRGCIVQVPPAYSAIKQGGVPLYKRARRGEDVEVPSREVEVFVFDLVERDGDLLTLHVECGSGTYVRSLARDLGEKLGCGAHLTALRRLWVEPFHDPVMYSLDDLEARVSSGGLSAIDALLLPIERGVTALPRLSVSRDEAVGLSQGKRLLRMQLAGTQLACAIDLDGRLVALVEIDTAGTVHVRRGINPGSAPAQIA